MLNKVMKKQRVAASVGVYDTVVGLWPFIAPGLFLQVTGLSPDLGIVRVLALAWLLLGILLLLFQRINKAVTPLAVSSIVAGSALAILEIFLVVIGRISPVFLIQALAEALIGITWIMTLAIGDTVEELRA